MEIVFGIAIVGGSLSFDSCVVEVYMLVLSRRIGETLHIGNDIQVVVLGVNGNQIRLGIKAPREVSIHREEIYRRIQEGEEKPRKFG